MVTYSETDFVTNEKGEKRLTIDKQNEITVYTNEIKNLQSEIWKSIDGFPGYSISNFGKVRNDENNAILDGSVRSRAYISIIVIKNAKPFRFII
jgi:hypothetical protein